MLSAPDIKFEPPQMKIYQFSDSNFVALVSGDPSAQITMCDRTQRVMDVRLAQGKPVTTVEDVAKLYAEAFTAYRRERAETKYLKPVGLDVNEFVTRQAELRPDFVATTVNDLQHCTLDCETIIAGKDASGLHIYVVSDPGEPVCADAIAFASIGSGKHHAEAQFMLARHTRHTLFHTALFHTYAAKKKAEVSPTVGSLFTDLFYIGVDGFNHMPPDIAGEIDNIWRRYSKRDVESLEQAEAEAKTSVVEHLERHEKAQAQPLTELPAATKSKPKLKRPKRPNDET